MRNNKPKRSPCAANKPAIFEAAGAKQEGVAVAQNFPRPLAALRQHCLWCCNYSASEVDRCTAKSCGAWTCRYGRKPTPEILAEAGDRAIYPLEDGMKVADFQRKDGAALKAIKRRCLDCSGSSKGAVRECRQLDCDLYPYRFGKNPHRKMTEKRRAIAAARLLANLRRRLEGT